MTFGRRFAAWFLPLSLAVLALLLVALDLKGTYRIGIQALLLLPFVALFLAGRCQRAETEGTSFLPLPLLLVPAVLLAASVVDFLILGNLPLVKLFVRSGAFLFMLLAIPALWACAGAETVLRALRTYSFVAVPLALLLYLPEAVGGNIGTRLTLGHNPNELAMILLAAMPGLLWRMNRLSAVGLAVLFYLLILTTSRSVLLAALVMLLAWLVVEGRVRWRMVGGALAGLMLLPAGVWMFGMPIMQQLMRMHSISHRLACWRHGLLLVQQNPITGNGLGLHGEFLRGRVGDIGMPAKQICFHLHNEWYALLADVGVAGVLAWAFLLAVAARGLWQWRREHALARLGLVALIGYLTVGMGETIYLRSGHMLWFVFMLLILWPLTPGVERAEVEVPPGKGKDTKIGMPLAS